MAKNKGKKSVKFKYVIPDNMRDCYVSGAYGGISNRGELHMHLFSERPAIPKAITSKINEDGTLEEIDRDIGGDIVRLIQASVIMNIGTAKLIQDWLNKMISSFDEATAIRESQNKESEKGESNENE